MITVNAWRWSVLGLVLAAVACGGASSGPGGPTDDDGDGFDSTVDCDDHDPGVWQLVEAYRDLDGDGHGAGALVQVCAGASLPQGYASSDDDCDDADPAGWRIEPLYVDSDGDGVGAGEPVAVCTGEGVRRGYARTGGDCAPGDATRWQELAYVARDADGDGVTVDSAGVVCAGASLPAGYTITPSGQDCDDGDPQRWVSMNGYLDADLDGVGAGPQLSLCTAGSLPFGYAATGTDCAPQDSSAWRMLDHSYRDADGDLATVYSPGSVCTGNALPAGYSSAPGLRGNDCDDTQWDRWQLLVGHADQDHDGVGADAASMVCSGSSLPSGWLPQGGDCADDDASRWRTYAYSYRDADGDGAAVFQMGTLCIGASAPPGYLTSPTTVSDCDDRNPAVSRWVYGYADQDGDGVGAGASIASCTDGTLPAGQVASGSDCAPADPAAWQRVSYAGLDEDGDGYTTRVTGTLCTDGTIPAPYVAAVRGNDCDDQDPSLYRWVVLYPDGDGDGVGAPPRIIPCLGDALPAGYSIFGWDPDDGDPSVNAEEGDVVGLL